ILPRIESSEKYINTIMRKSTGILDSQSTHGSDEVTASLFEAPTFYAYNLYFTIGKENATEK
ncbi:MAG TPA: hypothetical protein VFJ51_14515, partial [Nitrososphaeraceae archaeon]|nr:hypothetical protein [Nitrososphaeraceae archaeon]